MSPEPVALSPEPSVVISLPSPDHVPATPDAQGLKPSGMGRLQALGEVLICSGLPTQTFAAVLVAGLSRSMFGPGGRWTLGFLAWVLLLDTLMVLGLVRFLLRAQGERPATILLGSRSSVYEARLGVGLLVPVFAIVALMGSIIARLAPWLLQPDNPLTALVHSPTDAALLAAIGMLSGGLREEVQRAFILHRFEQYLGGPRIGLLVFSVLFGLGHYYQGWAVAMVTGLLGLFWGVIYLWRRSIVAPVVSHAAFNLLETLALMGTR